MAQSLSDGTLTIDVDFEEVNLDDVNSSILESMKRIEQSIEKVNNSIKQMGTLSKSSSNKLTKSLKSISTYTKKLNGNLDSTFSKLKTIGTALLSIKAIQGVFTLGKQAVSFASDLQEVQNIVNVTFGSEYINKIENFAKVCIDSFGLSEVSAKRMAGSFMAMGKSIGIPTEQASDMSIKLTALAGDFSSFYNVTTEMAQTALNAIYTGETETMKMYGVILTEANLQAYATEQGITKSVKKMNASEKTLLRYNYTMQALEHVQGDFVRTQDNWANQLRVLQERWKQLMIALGDGLIVVLNPLLNVLNHIVTALTSFITMLGRVISTVFGLMGKDISKQGLDIADSAQQASDAEDSLADATEKAGKAAQKALAPFDELNVLQQDTSSSSDTDSGLGGSVPMIDTDYGEIADIEDLLDPLDEKMTLFFMHLQNLLEQSQVPLENLLAELDRLGRFSWAGLSGFYNHFLKPVAEWTLGEGLPRFLDITTNGLEQVDWASIVVNMNDLWTALSNFSTGVIGEGLLWFYENVLVPLGVWFLNDIVPPAIDIITGSVEILTSVLEALGKALQPIWDNFISPFIEVIGNSITTLLETFGDILKDLGDWMVNNQDKVDDFVNILLALLAVYEIGKGLKWIVELLTLGTSTLGTIGTLIIKGVNLFKTMSNILSLIMGVARIIIGEVISFVIANPITLLIAGIVLLVVAIYKYRDEIKAVLQKAFAWISDKFSSIKEFFSDVLSSISDSISSKITFIKDKISGAKEFIKGVWDGVNSVGKTMIENIKTDIENGWNNIKNIFSSVGSWLDEHIITPVKNGIKGAINFIIGGVEGMLNGIINGINVLIKAINKISFDIPDWVPVIGGNTWGFSIPSVGKVSLPRLATGAVIPPNKEFMAVLGDQKQGTNIETPENLLRKIIQEEMGSNQQDITITFSGTMAQFVRALNPEIKKENRRVGATLIGGSLS